VKKKKKEQLPTKFVNDFIFIGFFCVKKKKMIKIGYWQSITDYDFSFLLFLVFFFFLIYHPYLYLYYESGWMKKELIKKENYLSTW
jgi:hypothetical protein